MRDAARLAARLALAGALAAGTLTALAEDFEFEVPVQLAKIDPIFTQGKVRCAADGIDRENPGVKGNPAVIGSGSATFSLSQGGFDGTVSVKFNAERPRRLPADARAWRCALSLVGPSGSESLCIDASDKAAAGTNRTSRSNPLPAFLNIDESSLKACAQGTIAPPK